MLESVKIYSPTRVAARTLLASLVILVVLLAFKRTWLSKQDVPPSPLLSDIATSPMSVTTPVVADYLANPLVPVIELPHLVNHLEQSWSSALARLLNGRTEAQVTAGRVDVLTDRYAIEVDRLDKWHEGIGQAAHYGLETDRIPVVAIIIPPDMWPISPTTAQKLKLIEKTCFSQHVLLVLMREETSAK